MNEIADTHIYIDANMKLELKKLAKKRRQTLNSLINCILEEYLKMLKDVW